MALQTNLNSEEIAEFAKVYSIGNVLNYTPMSGGWTNSSFLIETESQKYVLTICEDKDQHQALILTNLLNHLQQYNFQTNSVISSKYNEDVLRYEDKPVYMKQFLEGKIVDNPSLKFFEQLGIRIAQLHKIPPPDDIPNAFPYGLSFFNEITSRDIDHPYIEWLKTKSSYLQKSIPDRLPKGLVHGDIFPSNIIQNDGKLEGIIDFEEVSNYPLIFDLGMAIIANFAEINTFDMRFPRSLIKGYEQVRKLELIEKETLKLFSIYGAVSTSFWRFRQFLVRTSTPEYSTRHKQMVDIADILYEMDNQKFMRKIFD